MFARPLRNIASMASQTHTASPFTNLVVKAMRKLYPEAYADKSFDNTGLLLEAPHDPSKSLKNSVLLTIDLTKAVADEAIERGDSIIIAYHPIIFKGLKALTLANSQQQSLLRLAQAGISVYCPHTTVDASPCGNADWLADILTAPISDAESREAFAASSQAEAQPDIGIYTEPRYPCKPVVNRTSPSRIFKSDIHGRKIIRTQPEFGGLAGFGRLITFPQPICLAILLSRLGASLGQPGAIAVALPQKPQLPISQRSITTVAICAGSGSSVFSDVSADLFVTGEMAHHDALAATERGSCVIALGHSVSERGYLETIMRPLLEAGLQDEKDLSGWEEPFAVEVSRWDRDPFGMAILRDL